MQYDNSWKLNDNKILEAGGICIGCVWVFILLHCQETYLPGTLLTTSFIEYLFLNLCHTIRMALCIDGKSRSSESCRETFFDFFNPEFHHQKGSPKKLLRCGILFDSLYQLCIPPWDSVSFKYIYIYGIFGCYIQAWHFKLCFAMLCKYIEPS